MAWQDRTLTAKYESPSGAEFEFIYESVSVEVDKKTGEFNFPELDGAYIQDLGRSGRRFPFTLFFSGEDYDTMSDDFLNALEEKGIGTLTHPKYGTRKVVPTGTITRRDDLVSEAGQSSFNVTFSETIENITFPSSTKSAENEMSAGVESTADSSAVEFSESIDIENNGDKINLQTMMKQQLSSFTAEYKMLLQQGEDYKAQYTQIATSYENTIDDMFSDVETVARQGIDLIRLPAKIVSNGKEKLQIFSDVFSHLGSDFLGAIAGYTNNPQGMKSYNNIFRETNKNLNSVINAACEGVLYSEITNRKDAIELSELLSDLFDDYKDFLDDYLLDGIDTGEGYASLINLIGVTVGYLVAESFNLPREKKIILGSNRNMIELVAEIYGDLNKLDDFILDNNLTCDEMEVLTMGSEVIYYE